MSKKQTNRKFAPMTDAELAAIAADEHDPDAKTAAGVLGRRKAREARRRAQIKAGAKRSAAQKKAAAAQKKAAERRKFSALQRNEGAGQRPTSGKVRRGS